MDNEEKKKEEEEEEKEERNIAGPFIRGKIRRVLHKTHLRRVSNKTRTVPFI